MNQTELAALLGKTTHWLRDRGDLFERGEDGRYDLPTAIAALVDHEVRQRVPQGDKETLKLQEMQARIRRDESIAAKNELDVKQRSSDLVSKHEVKTTIGAILAAAVEQLDQLPDLMASNLPQESREEITNHMRRQVRRTLLHLEESLTQRVIHEDQEQ